MRVRVQRGVNVEPLRTQTRAADAPRRVMPRPICLALVLLCSAAAPLLAQNTAGVGSVRGVVVDADGARASDVAVCVTATGQCAVSDDRGLFAISDVRAGTYQLEVVAPGQPPFQSQNVAVRAGLEVAVDVALPDTEGLEQTVVVTASAFATPEGVKSSGFLVSSTEIARSAGALQDVVRYVQSLPGAVIGTDDFRNDIIVRGGSPLENLYIVDNIEIPNINTFANFASAGGTVSMLDAQLVQDVTFLTGGYPAPYGNRTSSVLQVTQREGSREQVAARATLGFAGAGGVVEGPIGGSGKGSWIASARRSFLDAFTNDTGIGGVPVLYTVNAKAVYDLSPRDRVWAVSLAGFDTIRLGLTEDSDPSEELSNFDINYDGRRSATGFNWQRVFGRRGVGLLGVTHARASLGQQVKDLIRNGLPPPGAPVPDLIASSPVIFREQSSEAETTVKYDLTAYVPLLGKVQVGGAAKAFQVDYDAASPFGSDSPYFPEPDANPFALRERFTTWQPGAYVQASRAVTPRLELTGGARVDRYQFLDATRVSPRAGASFELTRRLSLRGSYGRFYQQPFFLFASVYPENRQLLPFRADHVVGGVVFATDDRTRVTVEAYRKDYRDYPVSSQIPALSLANVGDTFAVGDVLFPMVSAGRGRAEGVELYAERKAVAGARWYGQANLAFSRARHAGTDGVLRAGSFDYPVVANLVGGYRLGSRWDASARVAYLAGRPYTPFDLGLSGAQRRAVFDVGRVNGERAPDYFRLDLRVDRTFTVGGRTVAVFAGAQNVTNRKNVASYSWDRRNNEPRTNTQLGVFPLVGLDWRF
jgi:hypothetical protein